MNHDNDYPQHSDQQWDAAANVDGDTGYIDETEDTEAIKAQIEQTRTEMSHTIDAIQHKLNPDRLVEQVKDSVRDATVGRAEQMVYEATDTAREMSSSFVDRLLDNPIPSAMVAIGLGWLYMKGGSSRKSSYRQDSYRAGNRGFYEDDYSRDSRSRGANYGSRVYPYDRQQEYGPDYRTEYRGGRYADEGEGITGRVGNLASEAQRTVGNVADQAQRTVGNVAEQAQQKVSNLAEGAQQTASDVASQAQETVSNLADEARTVAYDAREYVGEWGDEAYYRAERAGDRLEQLFYRNPMALAGVALALGAAVGAAVPTTRREAEMMGEVRDNLVNKAQGVVQETVQKVQTVAEEATQTIKQEVKDQGLLDKAQQAAQEVTQVAKDVVAETKQAVKQEVREQGLTPSTTGATGSGTGMAGSTSGTPRVTGATTPGSSTGMSGSGTGTGSGLGSTGSGSGLGSTGSAANRPSTTNPTSGSGSSGSGSKPGGDSGRNRS